MARRISSRLSRSAANQSRKQFLIFGGATIIIIALLIIFSGTILNLFGTVVFGIKGEEESSTGDTTSAEFLLAPDLLLSYDATSSAKIDIKGTSSYENGTVILFVNGREEDSVKLNDKTEFTIKNVPLRNGENTLQTLYKNDGKQSEKSQEYSITRVSEKPELELSDPAENATFTKADKKISVRGKTDPSNTITVNGFRAVTDNEGNFTYLLELQEGENTVKVIAENEAGLETVTERKVTYRAE